MKKIVFIIGIFLLGGFHPSVAQVLKPGFQKSEYLEMLKIAAAAFDKTATTPARPDPADFKRIYRSPEIGLKNRWDLWVNQAGNIGLISIRGTTDNPVSNLANYYATMVPAKGKLQVTGDYAFDYDLSDDTRAAVHVGYLIATSFLVRDILPKIDSLYKKGIHDLIITGHSQGGAITYLLTAYLYRLQQHQQLPADIRLKTYASAAPKVGNLYFAYEYESLTGPGWAFNVTNTADWVPEAGLSIQTVDDFSKVNGFVNAETFMPGKGLIAKYVYGRMSNPAKDVRKIYMKFVGTEMAKAVRQALPGFVEPVYYNSMNYTRAGVIIPLKAEAVYYQSFPDDPKNLWSHHTYESYYYLANKLPEDF
jgi:hypothetical protein